MYAFGKTGLIFNPFTPSLFHCLTIPTFELESTILRSSSILGSSSILTSSTALNENTALRSNSLRYLNKHLREFLILFIEFHRLFWTTIFGVFLISFFLKVWALRSKSDKEKPKHEADDDRSMVIAKKSTDVHRAVVIEKSKDLKSDLQLISKHDDPEKSEYLKSENPKLEDPEKLEDPKPDAQLIQIPLSNWRLYNLVVITSLSCEWFFVIFYMLFMIVRYLSFDKMVDCIMDGLQNVTQLQNETYLEDERTFCARYGIPSNYGRLGRIASDLWIRNELRNQTFLESADYFWGRQREFFNFKTSALFQAQFIIFSWVSCPNLGLLSGPIQLEIQFHSIQFRSNVSI